MFILLQFRGHFTNRNFDPRGKKKKATMNMKLAGFVWKDAYKMSSFPSLVFKSVPTKIWGRTSAMFQFPGGGVKDETISDAACYT